MRFFSFSALRIQTAGYSAQARAEIVLNGIEDPKDLQEKIMGFVRSARPVAVEGAGAAADAWKNSGRSEALKTSGGVALERV